MTEEVRLFIIVLCKGNFLGSSRRLLDKKNIYLDWLFDINKRLYSSLSMSTSFPLMLKEVTHAHGRIFSIISCNTILQFSQLSTYGHILKGKTLYMFES